MVEALPQALSFQIYSTSSNVNPLVSGTQKITNTNAITAMPARIRKVAPVPTASAMERNVCATIRFEIQFTVADMPPHIPRYASGYISEFTVQGTGPIPGEKKAMYNANPKTATQPYRPLAEPDDWAKNAPERTRRDSITPDRLERANFLRPAWSMR